MSISLSSYKFLIVDDQLLVRTLITQVLRTFGVKPEATLQATDGNHALHVLAGRQVDLVLCDMQMSPINGIDLLKSIRSGRTGNAPNLPFVFLSGHPERSTIVLAAQLHADGFVVKPPRPNDIEKNLIAALERERPPIDPFSYFKVSTGTDFDLKNYSVPVVPKQSHDLDMLLQRFSVPHTLEDLSPGDILAEDVFNHKNEKIINRGVKLQQMYIETLKKFKSTYKIEKLPIAILPQDQMIMYQDNYGINP